MARFGIMFIAAVVLAFASPSPAPAPCLVLPDRQPTLRQNWCEAKLVLYGKFANPRTFTGAVESPTTDFIVEKVLKGDSFNSKIITLNRDIPAANRKKAPKFVVFIDLHNGIIDPFRGMEVKNARQTLAYLKGVGALTEAPIADRLRFYFKHLNNPDSEIAFDAFKEFVQTDYKDYKEMATKLPAETITNWIQDPKTPPDRLGLYGSLLGLCGTAEHGQFLRKMIDNPTRSKGANLGGFMEGYVSLQPKEAWKYITGLFTDKKQDFVLRYAGVRTARFLWEKRPDFVPKKDLVEGIALLLDDPEVADFAIEDFRKWKCWEMTDRILPLFGQKSHEANVVKRAIMRFALQSPLRSAADFVQAQRSRDPDWVRDTEELLKME